MSKKKSTTNKTTTKSARKKSPFFYVVWIFFFFVMAFFAYALSQSILKKFPVSPESNFYSIEKGKTYTKLIDEMAKKNQIQFPILLKIYQRLFIQHSLKAGVYDLHQGMNMREVLTLMSDSNNVYMNRIQVIEGTTFKQLKQNLSTDDYVKKDLVYLSDADLMQKIGANRTSPEGWFAPNTYYFSKGEDDLTILKTLYERQAKILNEEWDKRATNLPYKNAYEALIMASIIEKETSLESERTKVAGVFVRRLQQGMRLQTDPTVIYGMGERYQGKITREDLKAPTAYNTYTINGLPPTPIALPSQRSIHAALHPDDSQNLYFVATGKGGHTFSATLDEHNAAVNQYIQVMRDKKHADANP